MQYRSPGPVRGPVAELRAFLTAALGVPVAERPVDPPGVVRRRRVVVVITLGVGAWLLTWALRTPPGEMSFYIVSAALAVLWGVGALVSGPLHLGLARTRSGDHLTRPIVQPIALGALLLGIFLLGGLVVAQIPLLREPVQDLLDHARLGSLLAVAIITVVNGVGEEMFFRGALFAALPPARAVGITTVLYTLTTIGSGVPLLIFAAAVLGLTVGLQRRVTGGILAPVLTHLTWSLGILLLLPYVLGG